MSELIDRDELFLQIERARFDVNYNIRTNLGMRCFITEVKYALKCFVAKAPTVEERKHGHWDYSNIAKQGTKCSVCNRSSKNCSPFCQWCGAIMDEVSDDD